MTVAAPAIRPSAIIAAASSSGIQPTSAASSVSGSRTRSAPRARYRSWGKSALPIIGWNDSTNRVDLGRQPVSSSASRIAAAGQLPHPPVDDEPVTAQQQDPRAVLVQDRDHGAPPQPENVLGELGPVRQLHIREAHPDMRILVYQPVAVNDPAIPVVYGISRHTQRR